MQNRRIGRKSNSVHEKPPPSKSDPSMEISNASSAADLLQAERQKTELLQREKDALSAEIEELTKVLFQEANTMVASEAKAKQQLQLALRKLQEEHRLLQERLHIETEQLNELRRKLQDSPPATQAEERSALDRLSFNFLDDLFFEHPISAKSNEALWTRAIDAINQSNFDEFALFLNSITSFKNDDVLVQSPFMAQALQDDILPCLSFPSRSKSFARRIAMSMLANQFTVESNMTKMPSCSTLSEAPSPSANADDFTERSVPSSPNRLRTFMTNLTLSVTSPPESAIPRASDSHEFAKKAPKGPQCTLCSRACTQKYKFQLGAENSWNVVCDTCRDRLVAAGNMLAFIRHLRQNIFAAPVRSVIELYLECAQYRRACFYARTGGLEPFYILSDFLHFCRLYNKQ